MCPTSGCTLKRTRLLARARLAWGGPEASSPFGRHVGAVGPNTKAMVGQILPMRRIIEIPESYTLIPENLHTELAHAV